MPIKPADTSQYHGQALVSFIYDDGFKNNFDVVLPLHLEFNMAAGFAIIAGRMDDKKRWGGYMERAQVAEASRQGIEIYSHSVSHTRLTEMSAEALNTELKKSQEILNGVIDTHQGKVTSLCVPFSASSKDVIDAAAKYYASIRVKGDKFTPLTPAGGDPVVYSFGVSQDMSFEKFKDLIDKAVREKAWVTLMLHGVVAEPGTQTRSNEIDSHLLRRMLGYIKDLGADAVLPVNLSDTQAIRAQLPQPPPAAARPAVLA